MARTFPSDRTWQFPFDAAELWDRLTAIDEYPQWWPWLRRFDPGSGFAERSRWSCTVAPPLPYVVRFRVDLVEVREAERVIATVTGDVRGDAELTVEDRSDGTSTARLVSQLTPADPVMRRVAALAPPLVQWGHDWVLDQGRRQFVDRSTAPLDD